jgi:hypothetical protein
MNGDPKPKTPKMKKDTTAKPSPKIRQLPRGRHLRLVSRCRCKAQAEKQWGYHLWKWVGGKDSWEALGSTANIEDVVKHIFIKKIQTVFIKCNGCGNEMLRETPISSANSRY